MRFLRILRLGLVGARRVGPVVGAEFLLDCAARVGDRFAGHVDAVGSHIGDEARGLAAYVDAFIKLLGDAHGALRVEAELARGLLLQRRCREGRRRVSLGGLGLDSVNAERGGLDRLLRRSRRGFIGEREFFQFLAREHHEPRFEGR